MILHPGMADSPRGVLAGRSPCVCEPRPRGRPIRLQAHRSGKVAMGPPMCEAGPAPGVGRTFDAHPALPASRLLQYPPAEVGAIQPHQLRAGLVGHGVQDPVEVHLAAGGARLSSPPPVQVLHGLEHHVVGSEPSPGRRGLQDRLSGHAPRVGSRRWPSGDRREIEQHRGRAPTRTTLQRGLPDGCLELVMVG